MTVGIHVSGRDAATRSLEKSMTRETIQFMTGLSAVGHMPQIHDQISPVIILNHQLTSIAL